MDPSRLREVIGQAAEAALEVIAEALAAEQQTGPVRMVPIDEIAVRPEKYQFRLSTINASGTDDRLRDCSRFRRELAGVVLVWRERSGSLALVDGHHRLMLARRSGVAELAVLEVQARNAREARVIGALANTAAGNATATDLARLLRDEGMSAADLVEHGVNRRSRLVADAVALVSLDERLFAQTCTGEIPLPMALALAAAGPAAVQRDLHREATRRRWSPEQVAEAATLARMATVTTTAPDGCLPGLAGLLAQSSSNLGELLAIRAAIRKQLGTELLALKTVARKRSALALEDRGVALIDTAAAAEARDSSRAQQRIFDQLAGLSGGLHQLIAELAGLVANDNTAADVVAAHLPRVRAAIEAELSG